jgi:hypothetical protein
MSFIITLYVREGIVMASDSRLTLNTTQQQEDKQIVKVAVGQSDSNYKTFLAPNNIGISTYGAADIQGVPIAGYIESFISEQLSKEQDEVDNVPKKLLDYFKKFPGPPDIQFHVAGYKTENNQRVQHVWHIAVSTGITERKNPPGQEQGATWGGEADILARLIQAVGILDNEGKLKQALPYFQIPWPFFTLQDAIDYAVFAVKVTIDSIRFQPRPKTVGGPIDVLVIKPNEAFWVQKKGLHG